MKDHAILILDGPHTADETLVGRYVTHVFPPNCIQLDSKLIAGRNCEIFNKQGVECKVVQLDIAIINRQRDWLNRKGMK